MAKVKFTAKTKDVEIDHSDGQIIFDVREGEESISVDVDNKRTIVARPGSGFGNIMQNDLDSSIAEHAEDTTAHTDIRTTLNGKQGNIPASTNCYLVTHSGTAGTFGTPKNPADFVSVARTVLTSVPDMNELTTIGRYRANNNFVLENGANNTSAVWFIDVFEGRLANERTQIIYNAIGDNFIRWINTDGASGGWSSLGISISALTSGQDLNVVLAKVGDYYTNSTAIANSILNKPTFPANTTFRCTSRMIMSGQYEQRLFTLSGFEFCRVGNSAFGVGDWIQVDTGNYKTTETQVGVWQDGKPIYRRVFTDNITAAANEVYGLINIVTGIGTLVNCFGYFTMGNSYKYELGHIVYQNGDTTLAPIFYSHSSVDTNNRLSIYTKSNTARTNAPYSIWVEYTKA